MMRKGENPSDVLEGIKAAVAKLNKIRAPEKASRSRRITTAPGSLRRRSKQCFKNLAEGAILVTLVLFLFLGQRTRRAHCGGSDSAVVALPRSSD